MADTATIQALLVKLQAQQSAVERLLTAVESGIADVVDPERVQPVTNALSALEAGMADVVEALADKSGAAALDKIAKAISGIKPPTVNVEAVAAPAAPAQIHMIRPEVGTWKVSIKGQNGDPDRVMTIERLK